MNEQEMRLFRALVSSQQETARAMVQINNRLAEIGRELKKLNNQPDEESSESPL